MKKHVWLIVVAALCLTTACKKQAKNREQAIWEFRNSLTTEDTTQMLQLCDNAMELLKGKKIDEVVANLWEYTDSTQEVKKLTAETEKRFRRSLTMFPVLDYQREYYSFMLEGCNDVRYSITFARAEQAGTKDDAKTKFMFNPVKVDGEWKLCVKTANDQVDTTYLRPQL